MVYDFANKTYSATNTFGGSWKVIMHGSYSNTNMTETSCMYQNNHLLMITVSEIEAVGPGMAAPLR